MRDGFALVLVVLLTAVVCLGISSGVDAASQLREYDRKIDALTQFELKCVKEGLPYCQEVLIRMEKELDVDYTAEAKAQAANISQQ